MKSRLGTDESAAAYSIPQCHVIQPLHLYLYSLAQNFFRLPLKLKTTKSIEDSSGNAAYGGFAMDGFTRKFSDHSYSRKLKIELRTTLCMSPIAPYIVKSVEPSLYN
jgi:hypothetical protein